MDSLRTLQVSLHADKRIVTWPIQVWGSKIHLFFFSSASSSQSFKLTEQPIKDAVITVPAFFNQAERRAVLQAAQMAGLKVLQLINDNTAVALNYGVFRRKDIDATAKVHRNRNMSNEKNSFRYFDVG